MKTISNTPLGKFLLDAFQRGASTESPKTILEHYTEELNPSLAKSYDRKSTLCNIAAKATIVVCTILSASTLLVTRIFTPTYVLKTGIRILLSLYPVYQLYATFKKKSEQYVANAEQLRGAHKAAHHYQQLEKELGEASEPLLHLQEIVNTLLVCPEDKADFSFGQPEKRIHSWNDIPGMEPNPEKLQTLKPAIALHRFWKEQIEKLNQEKKSVLQSSLYLAEQHLKQTGPRHIEVFNIDKQILESKVQNAFVFLTIVQPNLTTSFEEIGDFFNSSQETGVIANAAGNGSFEQLFKFKNEKIAVLTVSEVKGFSTKALAGRLLEAI